MKNSITNSDDLLPQGIVAYANYCSFAPSKVVEFVKVQSRMLLWCESGCGEVVVNGRAFAFSPGRFLFIPWNHSIRYKADSKNPYLVAGIHLVPRLESGGEFEYEVFHFQRNDLLQYRQRYDAKIEGFDDVFEGYFSANSQLKRIAEYIVELFCNGRPVESMARSLASTLVYELLEYRRAAGSKPPDLSVSLRLAIRYISENINADIEIGRVVNAAGCCRAMLFRLFRKHLDTTPGGYILEKRIDVACELLRKSNLQIGEIADRVGISDRYYFSKLFKKQRATTPSKYRSDNSLLPG